MTPWIWNWSPQWSLPWSGDVAQRIEPDTHWFFGAIDPAAGNGDIERRACEVASYGRQLGLLAEVLIDVASRQGALSDGARDSLARLEDIQGRIETIKQQAARSSADDVAAQVARLKAHDPDGYRLLRSRLLKLFEDDAAGA